MTRFPRHVRRAGVWPADGSPPIAKHGCRDHDATFELILLTDLLTTELNNPGFSWTRQPSMTPASRSARQPWTDLDSRNLATDQKVGGSSSSERAHVFPGRRANHASSCSPSSSSGLTGITGRAVEAVGVGIYLARIKVPIQGRYAPASRTETRTWSRMLLSVLIARCAAPCHAGCPNATLRLGAWTE